MFFQYDNFIFYPFSILQVAKASSVKDVIVQALAKNRKDSESERKAPEDYVMVEEIDVIDRLVHAKLYGRVFQDFLTKEKTEKCFSLQEDEKTDKKPKQ